MLVSDWFLCKGRAFVPVCDWLLLLASLLVPTRDWPLGRTSVLMPAYWHCTFLLACDWVVSVWRLDEWVF